MSLSEQDREALLNGVVICGLNVIHNPRCGHVVGNRFIRAPREGDRLGSCCHRVEVAATPETLADLIRAHVAAALTEAADKLPELTEGIDGIGTVHWPIHDAEIYSLAIEEAQAAIRSLADPP